MRKRLLFAAGLLMLSVGAQAQQQPQFSHYGFNGMYLSPAYAGITNRPEFTFIGRYQYAGYSADFGDQGGSPQTYLLTASLPVPVLMGGLGVQVYRDDTGPIKVINAGLSYSYHIKVGEGKLGIGVQGNFTNIKTGDYRPRDSGDPNVPANSTDGKVDGAAGLWYQGSQFYLGLGVNNLAGSQYKFSNSAGGTTTYTGARHAYVTTGYNIELSESFVLTPTAIGKMDFEGKGKSMSFEAGVRGTFNDRFWLGAGYRQQEAVTGLLGVAFGSNNMFRLGYAFDLVVVDPNARARTSHEVMLALRLPETIIRLRPAIRTPRYSF